VTENEIIRQAQSGNRDAFRLLYEGHREKIFRLAYRYTRSTEDAEDVLQETFIRAFKGLSSYNAHSEASNFSAWIGTIGMHCAVAQLRRMKSQKRRGAVSLEELSREPEASDPPPENRVSASRALALVRTAQDSLPPRQRIIFDLRYGEHLNIKEIAARMDCGESNVKTQLSRAVGKLRKIFEPIWGKP
jgi:RNA polymerase sigma-70 factor (ECF subfamily)